jgi:hypothetical protein
VKRGACAGAVLAVALASSRAAVAGPPFLTDDPEPVDQGHYELYVFGTRDADVAGATTTGPALEFNAGILPNVQFHVVAPYVSVAPALGPSAGGYGDTEIGVKYRFIQETPHAPQVGIFPMAELATGNGASGIGNGVTWYRLPVWIQKSWGPWTSYGGGGWALNAAPGMRNYPFAGWLLQRDLSPQLTLGAEVFTQGASGIGAGAFTVYNVGGSYNPSPQLSVLFSAGHSFIGAQHAVGYLGLYYTFPRPASGGSAGS